MHEKFMLTKKSIAGYSFPAPSIGGVGFEIPNQRRTRTATFPMFGGFFASIAWLAPFGQAMWGAKARRVPLTGISTRIALPILRLRSHGWEIFPLFKGARP
jgi:hypothetical protein